MKTSRALALVLLLTVAMAAGLRAQDSAPHSISRIPVTVVLVAQLPMADEPYAVLRRTDVAPHDVILIPEGATPALLSEAIQTLMFARQASGDMPSFTGYIRVKPHQRQVAQRRQLPWAGRVLADVRNAEPAELTGIGRARSVQIWLPPQRGRGPAR
jgi:hypothetical protein